MKRFATNCLAALALAASAGAAQAACGVLDDPNSDACMASRVPAPAAPAIAIGAAPEKGRGQTACAFVDQKTQRCLTMRPNTKQYDSAIRTGVETAMMGMQYMADGREEARRIGIAGVGDPSASAGAGAGTAYNGCVDDGLARIAQAQQTRASPEQVSLVLKGCAR